MKYLTAKQGSFKQKLILFLLASPSTLLAAGPPQKSALDNPIAIILLAVVIALLVVIVMLAYVVTGTAQFFSAKNKKENSETTNTSAKILPLLLLLFAGIPAIGQEVEKVPANTVAGLSDTAFYLLMSVIGLELVIILWLAYFLRQLMAKEQLKKAAAPETAIQKEPLLQRLWRKANSFRSVQEEADIDLGHSYDNIRELDNRLPPWWLYGFYGTILFACIYLWRFQVAHTAPSSLQEYAASVKQAEEEKELYLATAKSKVDENTVTQLDQSGIDAGKTIFTSTCAPCHGADGGGVVGPNLTDDYWLHGGGIKDIFKTIKYGVQEKGMKPWKDDLSPVQIAQLASFIRSIHGAKVATPKEPQGEIYKEAPVTADSSQKTASVK